MTTLQTATAGANAFGQSYAYDGGSRLGQRTLARNGTTLVQESLGYDSLARLTTVNGTPQFAYDALGNTRWQAGVGHYRYEAPLGGSALRPNAVSRILDDEAATLETFAYDPAGNRTTGGGVTAAYTRDNRLAATTAQGVTRSWRYGAGLD